MSDAYWTGRPQIRYTRWMPQEALPWQHAFLWMNQLEVLGGGAAGPGKSSALLLAALQYVDVPGYSALLLRKSFPELKQPGGLLDRAHEWLAQTDARWNDNEKQWTFPSGATLNFGYLQSEADKYRYAGAEFNFIGFDELTGFRVEDYTFLFSRLRKPSTGLLAEVPLRMRAASNPGGPGHGWVKNRFMSPEGKQKGRIFIPARLRDNPHVDQESYIIALSELDEQTRMQLMNGDWEARPPGNWMLDHKHIEAAVELGRRWKDDYENFIYHGVQEFPEPAGGEIALGIDWGESTHGYVIWPLEHGGIYVPSSETINLHGEPGDFAMKMVEKALYTGWYLGEARYDAAGVQSMRTFVKVVRDNPQWGLGGMKSVKIPFSKYKYETINYMRWLLKRTYNCVEANRPPVGVLAIDPDNEVLIEQLFQWQRKDAESDQAVKVNDHGPDALTAGAAPIAARHRSRINATLQEATA